MQTRRQGLVARAVASTSSLPFAEDASQRAESLCNSQAGPTAKPESAKRKAGTKKTAAGTAVHSFEGLIKQMATLTHATKDGVLF